MLFDLLLPHFYLQSTPSLRALRGNPAVSAYRIYSFSSPYIFTLLRCVLSYVAHRGLRQKCSQKSYSRSAATRHPPHNTHSLYTQKINKTVSTLSRFRTYCSQSILVNIANLSDSLLLVLSLESWVLSLAASIIYCQRCFYAKKPYHLVVRFCRNSLFFDFTLLEPRITNHRPPPKISTYARQNQLNFLLKVIFLLNIQKKFGIIPTMGANPGIGDCE